MDAGFLCDDAAVFGGVIQERHCVTELRKL